MLKDSAVDGTALQATPLLLLEKISRSYESSSKVFTALKDITLKIYPGDSCAIVGSSGSGKSTLLNILGLLDKPTSGLYEINGIDVSHLTQNQSAEYRNNLIGFVFQSFNLLPLLSVLDNVALPLLYRGCSKYVAREKAYAQLENVGLAKKSHQKPADISGGQRQRVAIARALVGSPALILADEPTGNLDRDSAEDVISLLLNLNLSNKATLVIITHDQTVARRLNRCLTVRDGKLFSDQIDE